MYVSLTPNRLNAPPQHPLPQTGIASVDLSVAASNFRQVEIESLLQPPHCFLTSFSYQFSWATCLFTSVANPLEPHRIRGLSYKIKM